MSDLFTETKELAQKKPLMMSGLASFRSQEPVGVGPGQPYFDPLAHALATAVRFGTSGYDSLRGPGLVNLDFSLFRDFRITERFKA